MKPADIDHLATWVIERGLAGDEEIELLHGFCERCTAAGLPLTRALMIVDTLHPIYEGRVFSWAGDRPIDSPVSEYGPHGESEDPSGWLKSPFYFLMQSGRSELRRRLVEGATGDFPVLEELRLDGQTDWFALVQRFSPETVIGEMDCVISRWMTARPDGFTDADLDALRRLVPTLGLAVKSASLARVAESLVETYLGRDAGRRVLRGRMSRGVADKINAVLWYSDMRNFTAISDSVAADQLIPLLDDYAEAVISAVHVAGGDVLKLIGDGVLAIFTHSDPAIACSAALSAEADLRHRLTDLNQRRAANEEPITSINLGLHIGDVFYGNIGSKDRLDFTVVGQAVNEVSRIVAMCRSAERDILISPAFRDALPEMERQQLVSVGRYALRGVGRAQELFTLDR
ncbi:MAG TPA: adenylate/guanylate cyclase domain-containing protein [Rhizobiaceae bacterium]|nr:adenylate/guanylate cyclase domain-containing protein [Rhizobiaceae bacterium]